MPDFVLTILIGYLAGSIPFGLLLTWGIGAGDIRKIGSGNIGATNVLRTGHKGLALATLFLDGGKGAAAIGIGHMISQNPDAILMGGFAAFIGHIFPIWLKFKGGKGVATALGLLLAANLPIGLLCCGIWLLVAFVFRYSSLAALVALAASPLLALFMGYHTLAILALGVAIISGWRHKDNIRRLLRGEESPISFGQKTSS